MATSRVTTGPVRIITSAARSWVIPTWGEEGEVEEEEVTGGGWWGRRRRRSLECWHGNFSQPVLGEEEDFHLTVHLEELEDFHFTFKECRQYELSIQVWHGMVWYGSVRYGMVRYGSTVRYGRYGTV